MKRPREDGPHATTGGRAAQTGTKRQWRNFFRRNRGIAPCSRRPGFRTGIKLCGFSLLCVSVAAKPASAARYPGQNRLRAVRARVSAPSGQNCPANAALRGNVRAGAPAHAGSGAAPGAIRAPCGAGRAGAIRFGSIRESPRIVCNCGASGGESWRPVRASRSPGRASRRGARVRLRADVAWRADVRAGTPTHPGPAFGGVGAWRMPAVMGNDAAAVAAGI